MFPLDTFLRELTRLPHRGAATPCENEAGLLLRNYLAQMNAQVMEQSFRTPKTYVTVVYWLLGGLLLGLFLVPFQTALALILIWGFVGMAWLYFNWRYSPITRFPWQHSSRNIIGKWPVGANQESAAKLILMAHYDTAPVSLLYSDSLVGNFNKSLIVSLLLMVVAALAATLEAAGWGLPYLIFFRYACMLYFGVQGVLSTAGYWLYGYTNGASDNATGVAAALAVADRLRLANIPNLELEVVLTSAEEAGMLGAYHYVKKHRSEWPTAKTAVINFDTLGEGMLTLIEKTGTVEPIHYNNPLVEMASRLATHPDFRNSIQIGEWHTAEFDSAWLVRAGIPVVTLCALDGNGKMPRIHRPDDTLHAVNTTAVHTAIDFAEALANEWTSVKQLTI